VDGMVLGLAVGGGLTALWVLHTRRHNRRRAGQRSDWADAEVRPDLWTSAARCPHCRAAGGLLEHEAGELWFTCMACGRRHRREHAG
jgi:hypothetical protein